MTATVELIAERPAALPAEPEESRRAEEDARLTRQLIADLRALWRDAQYVMQAAEDLGTALQRGKASPADIIRHSAASGILPLLREIRGRADGA